MKQSLLFIWITLLSFSCVKKQDVNCADYYNVPHHSIKIELKLATKLTLIPITIDSTIECSYVGNYWIINDTLCFSDQYYGLVYKIRTDGTIVDRQVGRGKGPNEVISFDYSIPFKDNYLLVASSNSSIYTFSNGGQKIHETRIDWKVSRAEAPKIIRNPNPADRRSYEFDFGIEGIVQPWDEKRIAVGLTSSLNKFNGYFNTKLYYSNARILAIINSGSGKIDKIIGRRSPVYLQHTNIPNFDHFCFDVQKDQVLVNFWPDPKIYIIDKNKDQALCSFGVPGINMNTNYSLTKTYEEAEIQRVTDQQSYGHYHQLKFDVATGLLFRGYTRGANSTADGLQIYKDKILLTDIDVPKRFKVIGSIDHKFYAQIETDSTDNRLIVYQFAFELPK